MPAHHYRPSWRRLHGVDRGDAMAASSLGGVSHLNEQVCSGLISVANSFLENPPASVGKTGAQDSLCKLGRFHILWALTRCHTLQCTEPQMRGA